MTPHPENVIVAGSPGALVGSVTRYLERRGWAIKWPGQDLDILHGRLYYDRGHNCEVQSIHQMICDSQDVYWISDRLPVYYDMPYPGPQEFIARFPGRVVISSPALPPFLNLWQGVAQLVVDVVCEESADLAALADWTQQKFAKEYLRAVRATYVRRYRQHLKLFPKVFTMTNAEIRENRFSGLDHFLS